MGRIQYRSLDDGVKALTAGDLSLARLHFEELLKMNPDHPDGLHLLGLVALQEGKPDEAVRLIGKAIEIMPGMAAMRSNLATAFTALGRMDDALAAYRASIEIDPKHLDGWRNLAILSARLGDHQGAAQAYNQVVGLTGGLDLDALGFLALELSVLCEWDNRDLIRQALLGALALDETRDGFAPPFALLGGGFSPAEQRRFADRAAAAIHARALGRGPLPAPHHPAPRPPRLKIGYLSEDWQQHATAFLIAETLESHDRERFEIFAFSYGPDDAGPMRQRLRAACDQFIDIAPLNARTSAERIRAEGIDILVDLKGHTGTARTDILPWRAAPLQMAWLGYPGTFGGSDLDYILADSIVLPEGSEIHFSETPIRLPCYQPNDSRRPRPQGPPDRSRLGLPPDAPVFAALNNSFKFTPGMFGLWLGLLLRYDRSVLWLLEGDPIARNNLRRHAENCGVDPDRLVFAPRTSLDAHIERLAAADLFLDSHPCGAHTSASDALWAGVPVVTLAGETFASRVAASLLHALELDELIARTPAEYARIACALLDRPDRRRAIVEALIKARDKAALFSGKAFAPHLERAYDRAWDRWEKGLGPAAIDVTGR